MSGKNHCKGGGLWRDDSAPKNVHCTVRQWLWLSEAILGSLQSPVTSAVCSQALLSPLWTHAHTYDDNCTSVHMCGCIKTIFYEVNEGAKIYFYLKLFFFF